MNDNIITDQDYYVFNGIKVKFYFDEESNKYIKTLIFPTGFRQIVQYALACCKNLETLYIPKTLESVLLKAFYFAESVRDVYFEGTEEEWSNINFTDCNWSLTDAEIHFNYDYRNIKF